MVDRKIERCLDFARHDKVVAGMTKAADKIIVALDVPTKRQALDLVEKLRDQISFFKIGLQLYTAEGPEIVRAVSSTGSKVWLDLKLHDIPNTVGESRRIREPRWRPDAHHSLERRQRNGPRRERGTSK